MCNQETASLDSFTGSFAHSNNVQWEMLISRVYQPLICFDRFFVCAIESSLRMNSFQLHSNYKTRKLFNQKLSGFDVNGSMTFISKTSLWNYFSWFKKQHFFHLHQVGELKWGSEFSKLMFQLNNRAIGGDNVNVNLFQFHQTQRGTFLSACNYR